MRAFFTSLLEYSPVLAAVLVTALVMWGIMRWINKFYNRVVRTEEKVNTIQLEMKDVATKKDVERTEEKMNTIEVEMKDLATKKDVAMLKENDMHHLGKAMLLMATELLKNNPERFERVKDTILETTPENRRDEIKSITL